MAARPGSASQPEFHRHSFGVDARFSVGWRFHLRFTDDALDPADTTLRDAIDVDPQQGAARVLTIIDDGVAAARPDLPQRLRDYADAHRDRWQVIGEPILVPGGERSKNDREVFERIAGAINDARLCRRSYLLVIGGGAVLDVAGFAAAVAHRGVRLIRMPTTILAQDDSGVGVKNGINAFGKKNFLGSFAPPWAVINDSSFLTTLSDRDWRSGLSECVKVALVKDAQLFDDIERGAEALASRDLHATKKIIRRSAELHLDHVVNGGDPFELTAARPLDFGHWSAHKLEQMTDFDVRHGEAVGIGIALDSTYSMLQGWLAPGDCDRIIALLLSLGLPVFHEALRESDLLEGLEEFREHLGGQLTLAMLRGIGDSFDVHRIDGALVIDAIGRLSEAAHSRRRS